MKIREALQKQAPSLELQRSAADEISRLDAQHHLMHDQVQRLECSLRLRDAQIVELNRQLREANERADRCLATVGDCA
jgi:hypothetical protein